MSSGRKPNVIPGFGLTLGYTLFYLSVLILIPLSMLFFKTATLSMGEFWAVITHPRVLAAARLTFGASFIAAVINSFFGLMVAWVLVRYQFPGKKLFDVIIDLPFALPTAVAGIALTTTYAENGMIGSILKEWGIKAVFNPLGVVIALTFIGLPFVIRTVQPVLEDLDKDMEEASACLGARRWQTFTGILFPAIFPALITGFTLTFARALGEYGSVIFISGNMPMKSEILPLLIITKLEQYDYAGATALAVMMLVISFFLILVINLVQWWAQRRLIQQAEL